MFQVFPIGFWTWKKLWRNWVWELRRIESGTNFKKWERICVKTAFFPSFLTSSTKDPTPNFFQAQGKILLTEFNVNLSFRVPHNKSQLQFKVSIDLKSRSFCTLKASPSFSAFLASFSKVFRRPLPHVHAFLGQIFF